MKNRPIISGMAITVLITMPVTTAAGQTVGVKVAATDDFGHEGLPGRAP